jgi:hypothetical protein
MKFTNAPFRDTHLNIFDTPASHFYLSDVIVDFATGLIYKDGHIVWETANENIIWYDGWISGDPRWQNRIARQEQIGERMKKMTTYFENKLEKTANVRTYDQDTTLHLLHPFGRYVYGHLYDTLQKLYVINREKLSFGSLLLPKTHEIIDFDAHLKVLNLYDHNLIENDGGLIRIKNLLFITPLVHPTTFSHDSYSFIRNKYRDYFNINSSLPADKKIFLTRRPGSFTRSVLNDKELEASLTSNGIYYFDGSESLKEVVEIFGYASHIAGVHGSLFVNNIFANAHTKYLEYCPSTRVDRNFYYQYKLFESYQHLLVESDSDHSVNLNISAILQFYAS